MGGGPLRALTNEGSNNCRCSPDSRYVVAHEASGPLSIYSLQDGKSHPVPGTEGMAPIRWSDNRFFFTYRQGELPSRLYRVDGYSGKQSLLKELVPGDRAGVTQIQIVAASPDGRSLSYSYQQALYELYVVEGLR
jgi:prolyl oligopeptidase PreP (S9A serine peptidase family)